MKSTSVMIAAALLYSSMPVAMAQQEKQTPEKAHEFFRLLISLGEVSWAQRVLNKGYKEPLPVTDYRVVDACQSGLLLNYGQTPWLLNWRRPSKRWQDGNIIYVGGGSHQLILLNEDRATRLTYALTVLEKSCDPTADSPF